MTNLSHASSSPGWTIAAVPKQDDYSWKISSEKIPHMTILFLGTPDYSPQETLEMLGYLAHAAKTMLPPFGLTVERRGELGSDQADVLFFDKNFDSRITEFRSALLKNRKIQEAFKNAEQYPQWTPHLTLGYPEAPAKEDKRDYPGISWVNFDKIVLWVNDFSGYEILLDPEEGDTVLMSELTHFGVPGMRWGHRKAEGGSSAPRMSRKEVRTVNKAGQKEFYLKRSTRAYEVAKKDPNALIRSSFMAGTVPEVMLGREFVKRLESGATFDSKVTAVFAHKDTKTGAYFVDAHLNDRYQKVKR